MAEERSRSKRGLDALQRAIPRCRRCPELRAYCADIAQAKRRAFSDWTYWGRPVPGFGDARAGIMIVGLAPAAHGANRTGRMFTGDRSGDFLYAALHRSGLASQPHATDRNDGLVLRGVYITAALRCAPPGNKPTPAQRRNCAPFLVEEIDLLQPPVIVCLGSIGWNAVLSAFCDLDVDLPRPRPRFGHAMETRIGTMTLLGCYHVSQQNTFTGRLTEAMIDAVLQRAMLLAK